LQAVVSAAEPSVFVADANQQLGAVVFAVGAQAGSLATAALPAHVGDALSIYYTGCGPLSEALPPGQPAPTDHLIYATLQAAVTVGDASAQILFNGLTPGASGLCQLNFIVPAPVSGTTSPATTTMTSALLLSVGAQNANGLVLPVVFEPNGSYLGNMNAAVTVIQYGDYQCPYCDAFFRQTWPQLKAEYVDTGKIRFLFQDMAFLGADSTTSAEAAHCAGDQYRFWQYHDLQYLNQGGENSGWASPDRQKQFAAQMGMNTDQFNQCLDSQKYAQEVQNEMATGQSLGVTSVPTFLVNGTKIVGAQPIGSFETVIGAALNP
jgi:protein-disulfide isomerase